MPTGAPDYYKSILLYGLYNGVPVPLACDEQGRLILVAEPVDPFGRAGTILMQDDFSAGLSKAGYSTGQAGDSVAVDSSECLVGGYSCKMIATAGEIPGYAELTYYFTPFSYNRIGVQFAVRWGQAVQYLRITTIFQTPDYNMQSDLRYDAVSNRWQLYDWNAPGWVTFFDNVNYGAIEKQFLQFKLIVDLEAACYHKFLAPGQVFDLTDYALYQTAVVTYSYAQTALRLTATGGTATVFLDNIIITQDES